MYAHIVWITLFFYLQDRFCETTTGARTLEPTLEVVERILEKFTILLIAITQPLNSELSAQFGTVCCSAVLCTLSQSLITSYHQLTTNKTESVSAKTRKR